MAEQSSKSNPFVTMFVPGLVLGLLVGGLAGAFLPPIIERMAGPGVATGGTSAPRNMQSVERDARPKPAMEAKPIEPKPDDTKAPETKPGDQTPPKPETIPPAPAPK